MGRILLPGRVIHDWHPFGVMSVDKILAHSSDVGAIKVALQLGSAALLRNDSHLRDRPADGHRIAWRKSWLAAAARKLVGQFDWIAGDGAGSERHPHPDHFRDLGDCERRNALPAAHRSRHARRPDASPARRRGTPPGDRPEDGRGDARHDGRRGPRRHRESRRS